MPHQSFTTDSAANAGICAYLPSNPNGNGPGSGGNVDTTDQIFFTITGNTVNPFTYTASPFAFSTSFPASKTDPNNIMSFNTDTVNHFVWAITGTSGNVTGADAYPYTSAGLGTLVSSTISPKNSTVLPNSGVLFGFIY
jgi:hypothetical protein